MAALIIDFSQVSANPLNPIGSRLRSLILDQLEVARQSAYFTHVILHGGGHHFSAGADLTEFALGSDFSTTLIEVVQAIENSPKPVIAAVTGKALGGGMELALSCHYRIATEDSSWGLPEVKVGLIPGAGGTQRLPKLIGMQAAIEMILSGKTHSGKKTLDLGIVDALVGPGEDLLQVAHRWGNWASLIPVENRRVGQLSNKETPAQVRALCQKAARKLPPSELGGESHHCALQALEASTQPLEHGMQVEEEMVMTCLMSEQGMARRHVFFAIRQAQRPIHSPPSQHPLLASLDNKCSVGVIGAGTMGSGIAMVLLRAGYSKVLLVDINAKALATGVAFLNKTIHTLVQRKKISSLKGKHLQKTLVPSSKLEDLKDCDLVVEAVVENMKIKQSIFKTLDKVTPKQCILLSNTSTLNIDQMSQVLAPSRQAIFAGWHFFSPANIMPLVEICVGQKTSPSTVGLLQALTKKIGKIGVPVGICYGFVGNRMVRPYGGESVALLTEGHATVERVDQSLKQFGMALGPLAMGDLAGNDVGYLIRQELGWVRDPKTGIVPNRRPARYSELADDLVTKIGRLGQKVGKVSYLLSLRFASIQVEKHSVQFHSLPSLGLV